MNFECYAERVDLRRPICSGPTVNHLATGQPFAYYYKSSQREAFPILSPHWGWFMALGFPHQTAERDVYIWFLNSSNYAGTMCGKPNAKKLRTASCDIRFCPYLDPLFAPTFWFPRSFRQVSSSAEEQKD